ncbi:ATP-binding protein [Streptomyces capparidis]
MRAARTERASPAGAGETDGDRAADSRVLRLDRGASSAAARAFARRCLADWGVTEDSALGQDAVLVVSELVTNALMHADAAEELRLVWRAPTLVVEVRDVGRGMPRPRRAGTGEPGGRGLDIVSKLAERWQVSLEPRGRKTVRAELRRAAAAPGVVHELRGSAG